MRTSLVITTYNWKDALAFCLDSVAQQRSLPDEVVVADDGSRADTGELVRERAKDFPRPLIHAWQDDAGFRAARVRNLGTAASSGDYVIFIDGDMILHRDFVTDHMRLIKPGIFLQGGRLNASEEESARIFAGGAPRFSPFMPGKFKGRHALRLPWLARRKVDKGALPGMVMSCNMGVWRKDLDTVNGFDEAYEGWGREDDDLAARLRHAGIVQRPLKFAGLAIHLWHETRWPDGIPPTEEIPNDRLYQQTLATKKVRAELGLAGHPHAV